MSSTEVVYPSSVTMPSGQTSSAFQAWHGLNPCPACGAVPHDAPEGTQSNGDPRWVFEHCWRCGFRPGVNTATDMAELRRQFEAFQRFIADKTPSEHPSLNPPESQAQIDAMQAQMAEMAAELARYRDGATGAGPTSSVPSSEV